MLTRALVVTLSLTAGGVYLAHASTPEVVSIREPLAVFPMEIGDWWGERAQDFDESILTVLGVDEYLHRLYYAPAGGPVGLYIGYYGSQRQGDRIHSPAYCLPAGGWQPVDASRVAISISDPPPAADGRVAARTIEVNRWVIQKGLDRQVVLYWYHGRGRVVSSEYWNKLYLMGDAVRLNRTDGALVRVLTPVGYLEGASVQKADRRALEFVRAIFPVLERFLPA